VDLKAVERLLVPKGEPDASAQPSQTLDELIQRRVEFLAAYQNAAYAQRYRARVDQVRAAESALAKGFSGLTAAVARGYFKLMAYKDEYEVARLYTQSGFQDRIKAQFEGDYKMHFHLAPPLLAKRNEKGELTKSEFGPWVFTAFRLLAKLRVLRGTALDIFGYTEERRAERQSIVEYEKLVDELLERLTPDTHALAVQLASIPEDIRGYGHVKMRNRAAAKEKGAKLLATLRSVGNSRAAA